MNSSQKILFLRFNYFLSIYVTLCCSFLLLFETLSAQDISVPFTSHRLAESHFLQLFNTQIEFTQLTGQLNFLKTTVREKSKTEVAKMMKVKVYTQANLEFGQMREMLHSYQHRFAQARHCKI